MTTYPAQPQLTRLAALPQAAGFTAQLRLEPLGTQRPAAVPAKPWIAGDAAQRKASLKRTINRAIDKLETFLYAPRDVDLVDVATTSKITGKKPIGVITDELDDLMQASGWHTPARDPASIPAAGWPPKRHTDCFVFKTSPGKVPMVSREPVPFHEICLKLPPAGLLCYDPISDITTQQQPDGSWAVVPNILEP